MPTNTLVLVLVIVLVVALAGTLPAWPYSRDWGFLPGGTVGIVLLVLLLLLLLGRL